MAKVGGWNSRQGTAYAKAPDRVVEIWIVKHGRRLLKQHPVVPALDAHTCAETPLLERGCDLRLASTDRTRVKDDVIHGLYTITRFSIHSANSARCQPWRY